MERITVLGAGLAGSLMAVFLAKRGYAVDLYEKRTDLRQSTLPAGRSINLALSARGLYALEQVGLKDAILDLSIPMRGRMIHPVEGTPHLQPYGQRPDEVIRSVSRGELNKRLLDAAEAEPAVRTYFEVAATGYDYATGTVTLRNMLTENERAVHAERIIAADGAGSPIRMSMLRRPRYNYSQEFLDHGYKELTIPATDDGDFQLDPNALHIWPRGTYMLIALPNLDGSFTCTLFMPFDGDPGFDDLQTPAAIEAFFQQQFPDARPLMPTLVEDFLENPTSPLGTIRCAPWHMGSHACLLGDASHAIVPFFGQGMNSSFEDCTVLDACIAAHAPDWATVFSSFFEARKANTDAIAHMAEVNYIEMRDRVNDPQFVLMRDVSLALERRHPDTFIPKYSMVSFHRIPYATALRRGTIQEGILRQLTNGHTDLSTIDWDRADALIAELLTPLADEAEV